MKQNVTYSKVKKCFKINHFPWEALNKYNIFELVEYVKPIDHTIYYGFHHPIV